MCVCGISRISPSWARAGCKKTLCLIHYPRNIRFIHSFIHSFSLSLLPLSPHPNPHLYTPPHPTPRPTRRYHLLTPHHVESTLEAEPPRHDIQSTRARATRLVPYPLRAVIPTVVPGLSGVWEHGHPALQPLLLLLLLLLLHFLHSREWGGGAGRGVEREGVVVVVSNRGLRKGVCDR